MKSSEIITLISAISASGALVTVLNYFTNRKKINAEGAIAAATAPSQIGLVSVQELEAKLNYLNRVISVLEQHNVRLEGDLDQQYQMNTQLNARVRELMHRCDQLESIVRKLCIDSGLDPDRYL